MRLRGIPFILLIFGAFFQITAGAVEPIIDPVTVGYTWQGPDGGRGNAATRDQSIADAISFLLSDMPRAVAADCAPHVYYYTDKPGWDGYLQLFSKTTAGAMCLYKDGPAEASLGRAATCPDGYRGGYVDQVWKCLPYKSPKTDKNRGQTCTSVGNPVNPGIGNKFQTTTDYSGHWSSGLVFFRSYNSFEPHNVAHVRFAYFQRIDVSGSTAVLSRPNGSILYFVQSGNNWIADSDIVSRLVRLTDSVGGLTGWRYTSEDDSEETYDADGKLLIIKSRAGVTQTLTYSDAATPTTVAPRANLLIRVADPFGHSLNFTYDTAGRLVTLTDPVGGLYRYAYDALRQLPQISNLTSVIYPDSKARNYLYNEPSNTAGADLPNALTGVIDENGARYATYQYDATGKAISTEHAGGVEKYQLTYSTDVNGNPLSTSITAPLGSVYSQTFQTVLGVVKSTGQSQPAGSGCAAAANNLTYDANGNVASRTDFNGNRTNYTYDLTRNLETSRTEGLTSSGATTQATRTITTVWHPTFRLPVQITNGNQQTTYAYNSQGDITQKTITDLSANTTRSWNTAYTYSAVPGVLLQKVEDGPRTDVSDLTTYDYYPADAACQGGQLGCRGQLMQITDALGHITRLTRYSANGQLEELTDSNGLVMKMAYDVRQRLTSLDAGGETTIYSYDPAGQVTRVTRPDGAYLAYSYDAAHRLIKTQDNLGNTLTYTLDAMGNRIKEEAYDPGGQLARTQSRVYDALSRLQNLVLPQ